jgi:4-aminobutyrate aminotransferase-like enzyme/Ser/Thr protein kinase RdoA (MazF antagonist)
MSSFTSEKASEIAKSQFNLDVKATKLDGYDDVNFMLETEYNEKFLLKISKEENLEQLDFQVHLLKHIAKRELPFYTARAILDKDKNALSTIDSHQTARLLSWLPGRLWAEANPKSTRMRENLGEVAGILTRTLKDFDHKGAYRNYAWDLAKASWTEQHISQFSGERRKIISHFQKRFSEIQQDYTNLPKSIIHNDLNDYNILVSTDYANPEVIGIIDFGDAVFTQTINDLAILLAYSTMHLTDPLSAACEVIKTYNNHYKFSESELRCLYVLVGMRLVISVTNASLKKKEFPNDEYFVISEKPAWDLLEKWFDINENFAFYSFRQACGFSAHPLENIFKNWAKRNQISLDILFPNVNSEKIVNLDMSVGSTLLGNSLEYNDSEVTEFKLGQYRKHHPKSILLNGYLEMRPFYTTKAFKSEGNNGPQYRTAHLGTDFWVDAGTPIHAPFDGKVKIVHHNNYDKDYGPLIILEHEFEGNQFFTLYGHLSISSLKTVQKGLKIRQGDLIGYVGKSEENGNWAPHLHFQLTMDSLGNNENFDGVCLPSQVDVWKSICPDPNLIFKEEFNTLEKDINHFDIEKFRENHLGKGLSLSYDKPLHIVRGEDVYLIDIEGRKYLDTVNNVNHVGHQHPKVVEAGQRQMAVLNTNTRYLHKEIVEYAQALLNKLPSHLSVIHFVNSGSEANELALRMARTVTGNKDMLAIEVGYHGNTNAVMDVSSYKFDGFGGSGNPESTHIIPLPDTFRGKYSGENCGIIYANHAKEIIEKLKLEGRNIAGFIGETMISCGGQIVPPSDYFKEVYKHIKAAGGICIADEVQTGFGRMGKTFWAFELYGVEPDIVTMGKPAGNGHPLAVVACTKEVAERFNTGMEYFNTFGGNPVSCAIGKAVLEVIEEENLQNNALRVGGFLKSELKKLQNNFPIIGDVRGEGLFLGFELTDANKNPLPKQTSYLMNRMKQLGILMSIDGPDHNVMKIKPPIIFSVDNANELISRLKTVFSEDFMLHF